MESRTFGSLVHDPDTKDNKENGASSPGGGTISQPLRKGGGSKRHPVKKPKANSKRGTNENIGLLDSAHEDVTGSEPVPATYGAQVTLEPPQVAVEFDGSPPESNSFADCLFLLALQHKRETNSLRKENDELRQKLTASPDAEVQDALKGITIESTQSSISDLLEPVKAEHDRTVQKLKAENKALLQIHPADKKQDDWPAAMRKSLMSNQDSIQVGPVHHHSFLDASTLLHSEHYKDIMVFVLHMVVFFDVVGGCIMMVSAPLLYNSAGGCSELAGQVAAPKKESIDAGLGMFAKEGEEVGFATCLNLGSSLFNAFSVMAKLLAEPLSKKITKKGCLLLYTFGGGVSYFLTFCAKPNVWDCGWAFFLSMRALSGFLGGSPTIVTMLISDWYKDDHAKREMRIGMTTLYVIAAVSAGPLIADAIIGNQSDPESVLRPFSPLIFAGVGSFVSGILVVALVMEKPHSLKDVANQSDIDKVQEDSKEDSDEQTNEAGKGAFFKFLVLMWIGRICDSLGDGSMTYLQTVAFSKFGIAGAFSKILVALSGMAFVVLPSCFALKDQLGYAGTCAFGQLIAGVVLALLSLPDTTGGFMSLFFTTQFFTLFAQMLRSNMVLDIVPAAEKDLWVSRTDAVDDLASVISPFVLVKLLDNEKWGPYAATGQDSALQGLCNNIGVKPACGCMGGTGANSVFEGGYLLGNGIVNVLSCIPYLMLLAKFPMCPKKGHKETPLTEEDEQAIELFRKTGERDWLRLELHVEEVQTLAKKGQVPPRGKFGNFAKDRDNLEKMTAMTMDDLKFYRKVALPAMIADYQGKLKTNEGRNELREELKLYAMQELPDAEQRWDIGQWICDYLYWAGYGNPAEAARVWKTIFMTAFPRYGFEYGYSNPEFLNNPIPQMLNEFTFIDNVLDLSQRNKKIANAAKSVKKEFFRPPGLG